MLHSALPRLTLVGSIALLLNQTSATAQITPTVLPQATTVNPSPTIPNQVNISGGAFSSDGQNRFHNFTQFNLTTGKIANFESTPIIRNIFARISGAPSLINGTLQISGGNSNLFLINPSGILFGKDSQFNLPAAFTATTATNLQFGNQSWSFNLPANYANLIGDPTQLTLHPTGSIVNSGQLAVNAGQSITMVSSTVVNTGRLSAPGGQITLAAVPGSQTVKLSHPNNLLSLEFQPIAPGVPLTPTSLPQLLAGSTIQDATGLERTPTGQIRLIGSGLTVSGSPGLATIAGTVDASVTGGNVQVFGEDILLASPAINAGTAYANGPVPSGTIALTANKTIRTAPNLILNWDPYWTSPVTMTAGQEIRIGDTVAPGGLTLNAPIVSTGNLNSFMTPLSGQVTITGGDRITTGNIFTDGKALTLTGGTITTGMLNSSPNNDNTTLDSGNITVTATGNVTSQAVDADARLIGLNAATGMPMFAGKPGNITLTSTGPNSLVQTLGVRARGDNSPGNAGGNVSITSALIQIGTGDSFPIPPLGNAENQVSIDTIGTIFLSQSGGPNLLPFQVGGGTANGTTRSLMVNGQRLDQETFAVQAMPYRVSPRPNITIESRSQIPQNSPLAAPIAAPLPAPTTGPEALLTRIPNGLSSANLPHHLKRPPRSASIPMFAGGSNAGTGIEKLDAEQRLTADFRSFSSLGKFQNRTTADARGIVQAIEGRTGSKPALLYFSFVPTQTHLMSEAVAQTPSDSLEITLVTAKGVTRKLLTTADRTAILTVTKLLRQEITNPLRTHTTTYLRPAQQLYQWLIAPMEAELKAQQISNLVFLPDAGLRAIPYSALHDGKQFLMQNYSISMMPSLSLTDITYRDIRAAKMLTIGISESTQGQTPLPSVNTEISALNQLWANNSTLKNQQVTLKNLQIARNQYPFPIIHLATHGNFSSHSERPTHQGNSYIQLWDEKLQLDQIRKLGWSNPPVELLVLSACKTAIGDRETELGFAGLAIQTGVKSTIASLWSVDDTATTALMIQLYSNLKSSPIKAEALRQAQITLASGTAQIQDDKSFRHPYYWSGFTLIGNPW